MRVRVRVKVRVRPNLTPTLTLTSGPTGGATLVTVSGSKLDLGDRLRCRFGHELREEDPAGCAPFSAELSYVDSDCRYGDQVVNATLANFDPLTLTWWARAPVYGGDAAATNVSCLSPPRADARSLDLEVSLNGQQYTLDSFGFRCKEGHIAFVREEDR